MENYSIINYYVDNYRGFKDSFFIPKKVNFLVGENSSGKTSIIDAVNILSDMRYIWGFDLNSTETDIGNFDDIQSKISKEGYFSVGITIKSDKTDPLLIINTYIEKQGLVEINKTIFSNGNGVAVFNYEEEICKYKYRINKVKTSSLFEQYKKTINDVSFKSMNYKDAKLENIQFILPTFYSIIEKDKDIEQIVNIKNIIALSRSTPSIIAPIRARPKSIYISERILSNHEGESAPFILRSMLENQNDQTKNGKTMESIYKFGKESGLFDSLKAFNLGNKKTSPFELDIVKNNYDYRISTVGYGVSQILPIIVELLMNSNSSIYTIQQPEVHLHPKAQAAFGDFIFDVAKEQNSKFIIETHSDFIIDRFRYRQKQDEANSNSQIVFFSNSNGQNKMEYIDIKNDGKYEENIPIGFREFFLNESMKYLEL